MKSATIKGLATRLCFWTRRGWPERRFGRFGLRQLTADLGAGLRGCSPTLALACFPAPRSCVRNASAGPMAGIRPQPGALWPPWRTRHQAPALPQSPFLPAPISSASGMAGPREVKILMRLPNGRNVATPYPRTLRCSSAWSSSPSRLLPLNWNAYPTAMADSSSLWKGANC